MGYTENCLPKYLAALGHEVHVITSALNVYGHTPEYRETYQAFLGPADQGVKSFTIDGYIVHRLAYRMIASYVMIRGLARKVKELAPEIVHSTEIASLQSFKLAALRPFMRFKLFTETHQHLSVMKPFLVDGRGSRLKTLGFRMTRTLPTYCASMAVEKCYAIAPDCVYVANRFYGVPKDKIVLQSVGTDTELFHPAMTAGEIAERQRMRSEAGYSDDDIVCLYTGRFSRDKNPLLLAKAVDALCLVEPGFKSLFIGDGAQRAEILACRGARVLPFMNHTDLAKIYRMCDIAVWPCQESMSMLDAAASGLPLVVSAAIGARERVVGNGVLYEENSVKELERALSSLASRIERESLGVHGRSKMIENFNWRRIAESVVADYAKVVGERSNARGS
jgi:glycosyltransferase involved in cell wall biosynthesis